VYSLLIMLTVSICVIGLTDWQQLMAASTGFRLSHRQNRLWSSRAIHYGPLPKQSRLETDPRDMIGQIVQLNELGSAKIYPGQVLTLPEKQQSVPLQLADLNNR